MYKAKQKNIFIWDAVELILLNPVIPGYPPNMFYDGGSPLKKQQKESIKLSENEYNSWVKSIEVYEIIENEDHDRTLEYDEEWLGHYSPMSSPGKIVLHINIMRDAFYKHIQSCISDGYRVSFSDLRYMAATFVRKTVYHEYFHHYTDVQRHLFGSYYTKDIEEALAVAWSRIEIEEYCKSLITPSNSLLYEKFKREIYNYCQSGYKDWPQYYRPATDEKSLFCDAVRTYTMPSGSDKLKNDGIDFDAIVLQNVDVLYQTSNAATLWMQSE